MLCGGSGNGVFTAWKRAKQGGIEATPVETLEVVVFPPKSFDAGEFTQKCYFWMVSQCTFPILRATLPVFFPILQLRLPKSLFSVPWITLCYRLGYIPSKDIKAQ